MRHLWLAIWVAFALGTAAPARANISIASDSECPSASEVTSELVSLLPSGMPAGTRAVIRTQDRAQVIELASDGEQAQTRELPATGDCTARVKAAAFIIAAWLDALPANTDAPPALPIFNRVPTDGIEVLPHQPVPVAPVAGPHQWWLGFAALGAIDSQDSLAGLTGEIAVTRVAGDFGVAAALSATQPRDLHVGDGSAHWWRPTLDVTLRYPLLAGPWNLEPAFGPAVGLVIVQGRDYNQNASDVGASWGVGTRLRLALTRENTCWWSELGMRWWPASQRIRNDAPAGKTQSAELSHWQAQLSLGISIAIL